ncbi:V-set and immunoglobulin domain-containing protein 10-like [Eucyclogobius newberryi]|uniref:V-set and immunoglobulin domain-containing protein 10-like n=1 Tax=Eucyclogobius newberryi TaxID=166745 RepID=UPI003B59C5A6
MTLKNSGLSGVWICAVLSLLPQGSLCQLKLTAAGPVHNSALVGDTVTLAVSYRGATNPALIWKKGSVPVVTWTIDSSTPPDIAPSMANVLRVSANGSLLFENVTLDYTSSYSVEMTKSGQGSATLNFTLTVYEKFENVTLSSQPDSAVEGSERFTLRFATARGVVQENKWFFNDTEIQSNSHYSVIQTSLVIHTPNRTDTGLYTLTLRNPFSSATVHAIITVLYGPDEPVLTLSPAQPFYVSGTSLHLSCRAEGLPPPAVTWMFGGKTLNNNNNDNAKGVLNLTDVQTSQDGVYTCSALNGQTSTSRQKNVTIKVYKRPKGSPVCSVRSLSDVHLQYECSWPGGAPEAVVTFPGLSNSSRAPGRLSLNVTATDSLSGTPVSCTASHPLQQGMCNITASAPIPFLPFLTFGVDLKGKIRVTMSCLSAVLPTPVVSWLRGTEAVSNGPMTSISSTQLTILDYNISTFLLHNYTCSCRNLLGVQKRQIQLLAPAISDSSLFTNQEGTVVTLTWEVPPTSIVTGFDVQMQGPDLGRSYRNDSRGTSRSNVFRTIQQKLGSARSADILSLDPKKTYKFRIVPKARLAEGEPSKVIQVGPGEGLSKSAIAGIAAGIPAAIILLLVPMGLIFLLIYKNDDNDQARYPATTDKGMKTKAELASNNIRMAGGQNTYHYLDQVPSERSMDLPTFVPPPPVRVATTV